MSSPQPIPGPSTSSSTPKLSKFLKPEWRDRPRSSGGGVDSTNETPTRTSKIVGKKASKLFSRNREDDSENTSAANTSSSRSPGAAITDAPVIIEPPSNSKPRPRPPRPSNAGDNGTVPTSMTTSSNSAPGSSSASVRNLGDFPSRLSGWFSHTFTGSSTDLSLPNILSQTTLSPAQLLAGSPKSKTAHPLITASKDHLGKAMRYLLDPEAQPDKSSESIWVLGVEHPGYEPPPPSTLATLMPSSPTDAKSRSPSSFKNPIPITHSNSSSQSLSSAVSSSSTLNPSGSSVRSTVTWPTSFYSDYTSRVWLSYRNTFPPIRDTALSCLEPVPSRAIHKNASSTDISQPLPSPSKPRWPWSGEKGWTSDTGWGCMLRTGQSLLANALIHLHLSRSWRRPTQPSYSPDYVQYVRILTWFLDNPSPLVPFGVHRMALAGKELGKEVGSWFGPSTAAGAIKRLVGEFEEAGLEVALSVDSVIYQSDVFAASATPRGHGTESNSKNAGTSKSRKKEQGPTKWGNRPVLILVGIRLGIEGVNPIYYESVKALFTFPQTVGIAGGRPSSSYYFVGAQGDSLFYLDPHHTRPAVPLRPAPAFDETSILSTDDGSQAGSYPDKRRGSELQTHSHTSTPDTSESERRSSKRLSIRRASINRASSYQPLPPSQQATPTSPISIHSTSSLSQVSSTSHNQHTAAPLSSSPLARKSISSPPPPSSRPPSASPTRVATNVAIPLSPKSASFQMSPSTPNGTVASSSSYTASTLDPASTYLATAYSISELRTFHSERVRKMPLSGLDPSMLLGFLCRNEEEWKDLRERLAEMARTKKAIFSVQDEPPSWPDENGDIDIESASDQDEMEEEEESVDVEDELENEDELETKSRHSRNQTETTMSEESNDDKDDEDDEQERAERKAAFRSKSSRHDTIVGKARPAMAAVAAAASKAVNSQGQETVPSNEDDDELDDDDDWVDPTTPSPPVPPKDSLADSGSTAVSTLAVERKRDQEDDTSLTPTPASPSLNHGSSHHKSRSGSRDLPTIPTTLVSLSRESTTSSRPSSSSRRLSQVAISETPVPFPTRPPEHRKHSSASLRSATSSIPTSPASSQPTSSSHGHSNSYTYHRAHHSHERDGTGHPFPGSATDESGTTSSDSAPSSDALGGDEKHGNGRGSLVPKRERRTTVGRTAPLSGSSASVGTPSPPPTLHYSSSASAYHHHQSSSGTNGSAKAAKQSGRTATSGGVRAAVWKDEDGDDF